ncbi:DNA cytosine methyltransferase [uncultured Stenotrophomonas sp.]|uniref:DNA cytosine methyltransferase n=1 Tax=uncultured Stenotrophomonas sp. TaxID=165438 RepID=UPI0025F0B4D1|nr:DNA cytosine methyltransferase [uncultured Stenotrophomonas sp.]
MKILNLYAGVGGNRRLWPDHHQVTAVEYDPAIAAAYADLYPHDEVITGDAHEYLLHHHDEFDFIWSSPPCQSHSRMRYHLGGAKGFAPKYPDMSLYEEIVLLRAKRGDRPWVVENVLPWYEPLIPARQLNRHLYWSNFEISDVPKATERLRKAQIPDLQELHGIDLSPYRIPNKRQVLRNMVPPSVGLSILNDAENHMNSSASPVLAG